MDESGNSHAGAGQTGPTLLRFVHLSTDERDRPGACSGYESDSAAVLAGGTGKPINKRV